MPHPTIAPFAALVTLTLGHVAAQATPGMVLPAGNIPLATFVDRCAAAMGKNVMLAPDLAHDVPIRLAEPVSIVPADGLRTFAAVLYANDHVVCWVDEEAGLMEVVHLESHRARNNRISLVSRTASEVLAQPDLRVPITTLVEVRPGKSIEALMHLARLMRGNPTLRWCSVIDAGPNRLMLNGLQRDVALAITMLRGSAFAATELTLPAGEMPLTAFVDACAAVLGAHVAMPSFPREVPMVRLQNPVCLGATHCLSFLAAQLRSAGFGLFWASEAERRLGVQVLDAAGARAWMQNAVRRTPQDVLLEPQLVMPVTTTVVLERSEALVACLMLRSMFATMPGPVSFPLVPEAIGPRSLEITGIQCDVARAIMLVVAADDAEPAVAR